jgi:hypothetical protein
VLQLFRKRHRGILFKVFIVQRHQSCCRFFRNCCADIVFAVLRAAKFPNVAKQVMVRNADGHAPIAEETNRKVLKFNRRTADLNRNRSKDVAEACIANAACSRYRLLSKTIRRKNGSV